MLIKYSAPIMYPVLEITRYSSCTQQSQSGRENLNTIEYSK